MKPPFVPAHRHRLRNAFREFTWGGEWAVSLSQQIKHNLTWFFFDGLFSSAIDNIVITYVTLYILALGASRAQVGLMSSFSSLSAAILLLPGAILVERYGHRKEFTLLFGGAGARLAVLTLALLPFLVHGTAIVWVAIGLSVTRDAFNNLAYPAWMSVTADVVPMEGRGRFFGSRNFVMGLSGMAVVLLVGVLITRLAIPVGYQVAFGLAFALGLISTFSFSRLRDPKSNARPRQTAAPFSLRSMLKEIQAHPVFLSLGLVMALWNFSVNIAGPFFNVFMVANLKFTASMVGIVSISSTVASLLIQRRVGRLADRWGSRKVLLLSMLLIPILPVIWMFAANFWHVIAINVLSGAFWGAFNLVSFNFLLSLTPDAQRARFSAFYQILVMLALAGGAALGAWVVTQFGYQILFGWSAVGRVAAAVLFIRFVPANAEKEAAMATL